MTRYAGPLRRAVAFHVNWGVQAAAAVTLLALASLVTYVEVPGGIALPFLILAPGALIDALLIARTGATPGQHALGIRVERREGGPLSLARALARQGIFGVWLVLVGILAPLLPLVALSGLADLLELEALGALVIDLSPLIALTGLVATLLVTRTLMERDAHLRAPFDRLAGTVVARRGATRRVIRKRRSSSRTSSGDRHLLQSRPGGGTGP